MPESNLEQLLNEAIALQIKMTEKSEANPTREELPLSPERLKAAVNEVLSAYVGHKVNKQTIQHMHERVASYMLRTQCLVGADVKLKLIASKEGRIKKVRCTIEGRPQYDPCAPILAETANRCNRTLTAVVDKDGYIHYAWEGAKDVQKSLVEAQKDYYEEQAKKVRETRQAQQCKAFDTSTVRWDGPAEVWDGSKYRLWKDEKTVAPVRFAKIKKMWTRAKNWVRSLYPKDKLTKFLDKRAQKPKATVEEQWRVLAGLIHTDQLDLVVAERIRRQRKWYQFWKR